MSTAVADLDTTATYDIVGTTDDYTACDCCGRPNLKVYIVLKNLDGGGYLYMGTSCAARFLGWTDLATRNAATGADTLAREARQRAARDAAREAKLDAMLDEYHDNLIPWA